MSKAILALQIKELRGCWTRLLAIKNDLVHPIRVCDVCNWLGGRLSNFIEICRDSDKNCRQKKVGGVKHLLNFSDVLNEWSLMPKKILPRTLTATQLNTRCVLQILNWLGCGRWLRTRGFYGFHFGGIISGENLKKKKKINEISNHCN